jgi:hypothetical protein
VIQGLEDVQLRDCLRAASYKLAYSPDDGAAAAAAAAGQPTGGAAWSGAQDLASLHEQRQQQRARQQHASISNIEDMLSKTGLPEDSWGFAELGLVVGAAVVGAVAYAKWQAHRGGRAGVKSHNGRRD